MTGVADESRARLAARASLTARLHSMHNTWLDRLVDAS